MEEATNETNFTNTTANLKDTSYDVHIAVHLLIFFVLCLPPLVVNAVNGIAVLLSPTFKKVIKVVLINISVSNIVYLIGLSVWILGFVVRIVNDIYDSSLTCQFNLAIYILGSAARFTFVLAFGTLTFIAIRYGIKKVNMKFLVLFCVLPWTASIASVLFAFIPEYGVVLSRHNNKGRCILKFRRGYVTVVSIHLGVSWVVWGTCVVLTLVLTIASYRYVKRNAISESTNIQRAILKFSAFLTASSTINIIALLVTPTLFFGLSTIGAGRSRAVSDIFSYYTPLVIFATLSWMTPLMEIYVFNQIREILKKWMTLGCLKRRGPHGISQDPSKH